MKLTEAQPARLSGETVLRRTSELSIQLRADQMIAVELQGRRLVFGRHALAILDAFAEPRSFDEAQRALRPRITNIRDWPDLVDTILEMHRAGILYDPSLETSV